MLMKNMKITFSPVQIPCYAAAYKAGRKTLEIQILEDEVILDLYYDTHRRPLSLCAEVKAGDTVTLISLPHRNELYVNGVLCDEEWPHGNRRFCMGDPIITDMELCIEDHTEEKTELPCVTDTFVGAEGWRPGGGVYAGDCMPYVKGDTYHLLYLKDRHRHHSKWGLGAHQWAHISTKDFLHWSVHPMAVEITDPMEGSICTGSWIQKGDMEYLFYTVRMSDYSAAPIRRSISTDGYHFEKDTEFGFRLSERYTASSARDPKVVFADDGKYHMFLTTTLASEKKGCLAHFVSEDMDHWEELDPIFVHDTSDEPECPDYIRYNGRYYLIFSLCGEAHYLYSDRPFDGWVSPSEPIIPCASVPKGGVWNGKIVFSGFRSNGGYAGTLTFREAGVDENGELVYYDTKMPQWQP